MAKKLMQVKWKDLKVGDTFLDGAEITELWPWQEAPCYELRTEVQKIVDGEKVMVPETVIASKDHLFSIVTDKSFDEYETTRKSKEQTNKKAINWIACEDAYNIFKTYQIDEKTGCNIAVLPGTLCEIKIVPYKNLEPQKCRCITTTHGTFTISNILFGQTARGSHSLASTKEIVRNLLEVANMSEEWIAKNLFMDLDSVKRLSQLSGLKKAFDNIEEADLSWNPEEDSSYERKTNSYLNKAAAQYVQEYLKTHEDAKNQAREMGDILTYAESLGWNKDAAEKVFQGK